MHRSSIDDSVAMKNGWLERIVYIFNQLRSSYPLLTPQHVLFLSVCKFIKPDICVEEVSQAYTYGGMVGYGNSIWMDATFGRMKIFRLHAAFHDAFGFMKSEFDEGPGYCYCIGGRYSVTNNFLLGHISGLLYWVFVLTFHRTCFDSFNV